LGYPVLEAKFIWALTPAAFKDAHRLILKLTGDDTGDEHHEVSKFVFGRLSENLQNRLKAYAKAALAGESRQVPEPLLQDLAKELTDQVLREQDAPRTGQQEKVEDGQEHSS